MTENSVLVLDRREDAHALQALSDLGEWSFERVTASEVFRCRATTGDYLVGMVVFPDCRQWLCQQLEELLVPLPATTWIALTPAARQYGRPFSTELPLMEKHNQPPRSIS